MRLRNRVLPQAGTKANRDGESRPEPTSSGCPSYSGGGTVSPIVSCPTATAQSVDSISCSSPSSLFSSIPSSPLSLLHYQESSSSNVSPSSSLQSIGDVVQEATSAKVTAPAPDGRRTRKTWTKEMNIFIMRHYFILTNLESNTRTYLTPLHARFTAEYPEMNVGKQRIGDQRRAIVQRNFLTKQEINNIKEEIRILLQNPTPAEVNATTEHTQQGRIRWSDNLNETIMRSYYRLTNLETDLTTYRPLLHQDIITKCPSIAHLSVQRIADQRRSIVNNHLLSNDRLNRIREEVRNELNTSALQSQHIDENISVSTIHPSQIHNEHTLQSTQTTTNDDITNPTQITDDPPSLTLELAQQLEDMYAETYNKFKDSNPTTRPYIPKLKSSKKLSSIINHLNNVTLPNIFTPDTSFNVIQTSIYCAAYTSAKFNGARIRDISLNTIKPQAPWWQRRLEDRISDLRANIGRLTEYARGIRSPALEKHLSKIKQKYRIHTQHETQNTDIAHFLDTLKQKLNALANRLKRYKLTTLRKTQNKQFCNSEKLFYRKLTQHQSQQENSATVPTPESLKAFWSNIWSNQIEHQHNHWIEEDKERFKDTPEMKFEQIHLDLLKM
ncbi:unnamed protein product [Colias eurytheme]|nr:unnamed protein product [Colias eurytheme]